jgi:hypothetical protein
VSKALSEIKGLSFLLTKRKVCEWRFIKGNSDLTGFLKIQKSYL